MSFTKNLKYNIILFIFLISILNVSYARLDKEECETMITNSIKFGEKIPLNFSKSEKIIENCFLRSRENHIITVYPDHTDYLRTIKYEEKDTRYYSFGSNSGNYLRNLEISKNNKIICEGEFVKLPPKKEVPLCTYSVEKGDVITIKYSTEDVSEEIIDKFWFPFDRYSFYDFSRVRADYSYLNFTYIFPQHIYSKINNPEVTYPFIFSWTIKQNNETYMTSVFSGEIEQKVEAEERYGKNKISFSFGEIILPTRNALYNHYENQGYSISELEEERTSKTGIFVGFTYEREDMIKYVVILIFIVSIIFSINNYFVFKKEKEVLPVVIANILFLITAEGFIFGLHPIRPRSFTIYELLILLPVFVLIINFIFAKYKNKDKLIIKS